MIEVLRDWSKRYLGDEQVVWLLLFVTVSISLLVFIGNTLMPILASIIIAYLLQPLVNFFRRMSLSPTLSALIPSLMLVVVILLVLLVLLPQLWAQSRSLLVQIPQMFADLQSLLYKILNRFSVSVGSDLTNLWADGLDAQVHDLAKILVSGSLATLISIAQITVYLVLVPLLVFFLLRDSKIFFSYVIRLLPRRASYDGFLYKIWQEMDRQLAGYVRGKVTEIFLMSVATYIAFALFGLDYALLLSLLTGLSVIIPYVGAVVVTVPILVIAYLQWAFTEPFVWLMAIYLVLQIVDGNVLVPLLFSEAVSLHPLIIILSILIFGGLWGLWGVFFAIPLATLVKSIFNAWPR